MFASVTKPHSESTGRSDAQNALKQDRLVLRNSDEVGETHCAPTHRWSVYSGTSKRKSLQEKTVCETLQLIFDRQSGSARHTVFSVDKLLGFMKSVLGRFAPRHLCPFVFPLFFGSPSHSYLLSCHIGSSRTTAESLKVPALHRGAIIIIIFLITASIQVWDTN